MGTSQNHFPNILLELESCLRVCFWKNSDQAACSVQETARAKAEAGRHMVCADESQHLLHRAPYREEVEKSRGWISTATLGPRLLPTFSAQEVGPPFQSRQGSELFRFLNGALVRLVS